MIRFPAIAALLLVAACSEPESGAHSANETSAAASANETGGQTSPSAAGDSVSSLDGTWNVAAIDGKPVNATSAMTASFKSGRVSIAAGCLRRAWTYTQKRNVVTFAPDPAGSANCGGASPTGDQETAYAALEQSSIAIFSKDGREASLSGTGGNLTLQRR